MSRWDKNSEDYFRNRPQKSKRQEVDTAGQTETFLTRNVRSITFFICLAIFLAFFGPWSVFRIMDYIEEKNDTRIPMTENDLIALSELERDLYYSDIKGFLGDESRRSIDYSVPGVNGTEMREKEVEIYYYIDVGGKYTALAIAEIETQKIIYFRVNENGTGDYADLLTDDIRAFLQGVRLPAATTAATQ
ncbi:MAG: hypothetical protein IJX28_00435 [Clostridia bacterium]|nr:hypothetical protein [Clostridia bacterium]